MKTLCALMLSALILALAGCGTVGSDLKTSVREKFEGPAYRVRMMAGDSRVTYEAARQAAEKLGFRVVGGGPAQGRIEALSGLSANDSLKGARQLSMKVRLSPSGTGTEVAVLITEQQEDDSDKGPGRVIETPLHDTPLYDVFFRNVEQASAAK